MRTDKNIDIKKIIIAAAAILVLFMIVTTIAKAVSNGKVTERDGYKVIKDVQGIEFQVKKEFSDYSTAVLEISKNIDFSDYQTYSYKNGTDTYLLFNMNSYIIIAKKGTEFDFLNTEVEESLSVNSLDGIWFSPRGKNPVIESSANKYIISVTAQVVITPLVYNDFTGTLTTITNAGEEWTLFAGTVSKAADVYVDAIEYTASTIVPVEIGTVENIGYAVVDSINNDSGNENNFTDTDVPMVAVDEPPSSMEPDVTVEENGGTEQDDGIFRENQVRQDLERGKVYESSPYAMLGVGNAGIVSIMNENGGGYTDAYIRIDQLYSKEETKELIQEYISSGASYYSEISAPNGTHFEAVSYSIKYLDPDPSYVDIKLCGLDGEDLRYRGVIYSHATHDINNKVELIDGWGSGYICFFAIPNGCVEYALSCGPGIEKEDQHTSYFYISSKE